MRAHWIGAAVAAWTIVVSAGGFAQELQVDWLPGPATGEVGGDVAEVDVPEGFIFAGSEDTRALMEYMGNPPSEQEAGFLAPTAEDQNWFIVFEYDPIGYVPDDEKDELDADAILASIRQGTEEANELRREQGVEAIHVKGWYEVPHYDEVSHNLVWAILGEGDEGRQVVNYNIRLLGRYGYTSATLVGAPEEFEAFKGVLTDIVSTFRYKTGKDYLSFVQGDKVAKYGLTALVAGGVGAAAAKTGLFKILAKGGKAIFVAIFAAVGGAWKWLTGRGKRSPSATG